MAAVPQQKWNCHGSAYSHAPTIELLMSDVQDVFKQIVTNRCELLILCKGYTNTERNYAPGEKVNLAVQIYRCNHHDDTSDIRHARRLIYEGGVSDEARGEIWRCLLSLHNHSHTHRQKSFRNQLLAEKYKDIRLKVSVQDTITRGFLLA